MKLNIPKYFDIAEEEDLVQYLENHIEDYFVVELENSIVGGGGINYFEAEKTARLSWDFFHPAAQGKGWGKKLVEFRLDKIEQNPLIKTIVVRTSQHTYKFYEKCGFALKEITKDYWAKDFDLYEMTMKL